MLDRVPVNPGRVLVTPENGGAAYYATLTRADNPTQEGTPLNKNALLKDATAALFGLDSSALPDNVLSFLGKYNQHWWRRRTPQSTGYIENLVAQGAYQYIAMGTTYNRITVTLQIANSVSISSSGAVSLRSPTTVTVNENNKETLIGKYINASLAQSFGGYSPKTAIWYVSSVSYGRQDSEGDTYHYLTVTAQEVTSVYGVVPAGEWEYMQSSERNAYPDSGIHDGYEYQYMGVPFDNAVTAPKIATGSYVGTGKYDDLYPNSLTFDFVPKFVSVVRAGLDVSPTSRLTYIYGMSGQNYYSSNNPGIYFSLSGNTLSWYYRDNANGQYNGSGVTYCYIAIG